MQYSLKLSTLILIGFTTVGMQLSLAAEDSVGLGLYLKPEYPGANDYETVVLPSFDLTVGEVGISLKGVDLSVDLIPSPALNAGLTIRYDEGRDDTESDKIVRLLEPVDAAPEYGLFIESGIPLNLLGVNDPALLIGSLNLRSTFGSGHGGRLVEIKVGILRDLSPRLTAIAQLSMVHSDAKYNRSYFGVDSVDANLTGLAKFTPDSSFKEFGATLILNRHMGGPWYAGVTSTASRLSSELADSPIVEQRGSRTQWLTGLFVTYHF